MELVPLVELVELVPLVELDELDTTGGVTPQIDYYTLEMIAGANL